MKRSLISFAVVVIALVFAHDAAAKKSIPSCKTPRGAADSVFTWQLGDQQSLKNAARCFEREGRTQAQLEATAKHLKAVYDSEGAFVEMDDISDDPEFLDEEKRARVVPHEDLPELVIERRGDKWLWTKASLDRIDTIYTERLQGLDAVLDKMPAVLLTTLFDVALWQYLALGLLVLIGLLLRKLISVVVAKRLKQLGQQLGQGWTVKLVEVVASPAATLATALILRVGYPQLRLPIGVAAGMATLVRVLISLSLVWAAYRAVDLMAAWMAERAEKTESKLDDQLVPLTRKTLKVVVATLGVLVVLQNLNFNVTTLLASVSIGTLAFGLAAKDTIANLFGSVSIFVDNPFQIGDLIKVDGVTGTVEEVGFRSTRIRTVYNSVAVMPNAKLADALIDNFGQREFRRCLVTLGLTYDTKPEQMQAFVEGCRAIIQANELTRKDTFEVHMSAFGPSSLDVMLCFFFKCDTWTEELRERHNIFLEIMRLAEELGVSFAFPTQTLHVEAMAPPGPRQLPPPPDVDQLREVVEGFGPDGALARPAGPEITARKYLPASVSSPGERDA